MDRVLRPAIAFGEPRRLAPDPLALHVEHDRLARGQSGGRDLVGQPELGELAHRVGKDVDPHAELGDLGGRLEHLDLDPRGVERQGERQPGDAAAADDQLHARDLLARGSGHRPADGGDEDKDRAPRRPPAPRRAAAASSAHATPPAGRSAAASGSARAAPRATGTGARARPPRPRGRRASPCAPGHLRRRALRGPPRSSDRGFRCPTHGPAAREALPATAQTVDRVGLLGAVDDEHERGLEISEVIAGGRRAPRPSRRMVSRRRPPRPTVAWAPPGRSIAKRP